MRWPKLVGLGFISKGKSMPEGIPENWFVGVWWHERKSGGAGWSISSKSWLKIWMEAGKLRIQRKGNVRIEEYRRGGVFCVGDAVSDCEADGAVESPDRISVVYPNGTFVRRIDNCDMWPGMNHSNGYPDSYVKVSETTFRSSRWPDQVYGPYGGGALFLQEDIPAIKDAHYKAFSPFYEVDSNKR
jgi:hypothetical protein